MCVVWAPLGAGLNDVVLATKNTFLHFDGSTSEPSSKVRVKSSPPRLSVFGTLCTQDGAESQNSSSMLPTDSELSEKSDDEELFTVMLRNIPCRYTQQDVLDLMALHGWDNLHNFFHLPTARSRCKGNLGYAFVGFEDSDMTKRFMREMKGVQFGFSNSVKVLDAVPARVQGLENNMAQFSSRTTLRPIGNSKFGKEAGESQIIPAAPKGSFKPAYGQKHLSHDHFHGTSAPRLTNQKVRRMLKQYAQ